MKVVKKVKDESAGKRGGGGAGYMGMHNQSSNCGSCSELFSFVEKVLCLRSLLPILQHFVRGSAADLHIFTVRTKLVIFQSITLPDKRNKDHEQKWWCGWGLGLPDFQLSTSDLRSIPFYDNDNRENNKLN
jgi:hypothetical protein